MAPNSLQYPHVDILKLFAKRKWSDAHAQGDVQQVIDKTADLSDRSAMLVSNLDKLMADRRAEAAPKPSYT